MRDSDFERVQRVVVKWAPMASASFLADFTLALLEAAEPATRIEALIDVAEHIENVREQSDGEPVFDVLTLILDELETAIMETEEMMTE